MKTRAITTCLVLLTLGPTLSAAARADDESVAEAVAAAKSWLELIDKGETAKSWVSAAALFKGAVTQEQWEHQIGAVRTPLGKLVSREVDSTSYRTSVPGAPDGEYVIIQFKTVFGNKKSAIETVTPMRDPDGQWRVSGYYIK